MPANKSPETRAGSVPPHAPQSTPAANAEISARAQRAILSIQASLVQARDAVRSYQKDLAAELAQDGLDSPEAIEAAIEELKAAEPELWRRTAGPDPAPAFGSKPGHRRPHLHGRI